MRSVLVTGASTGIGRATALRLDGAGWKVFAGVRKSNAVTTWTTAGFSYLNLFALSGKGNYKIGYQSLAGGLVNPPGGCSGAVIQVGP